MLVYPIANGLVTELYTDAFQQQGFLIGIHSKVLGLMIQTMCNPKNEYVGNKTPLSARSEV